MGLKSCVLENIEADNSEQRKRFEITLSNWLKLDGNNATWGVLELAISNANRENLGLKALSESKHQHDFVLFMLSCMYSYALLLETIYICEVIECSING